MDLKQKLEIFSIWKIKLIWNKEIEMILTGTEWLFQAFMFFELNILYIWE